MKKQDEIAAQRRAWLWMKRLEMEARLGLREGSEERLYTRGAEVQAFFIHLFLRTMGLYERGRRNACTPQLQEVAFSYAHLPKSLDGFRILHLSDLHLSERDEMHRGALRELFSGLQVDLCCLTGDYHYGHFGCQMRTPDLVWELVSGVETKHGIWGVLGNHDLSDIVAPMRAHGIRMLLNEGAALRIGDAELWLGGVDDPHKFRCASVEDAMAGASSSAFRILLAHSPDILSAAAKQDVDLYLCGHTHGGQVRFPVLGDLHANARCSRRYMYKRWQYGRMQGYTSPGLGHTDVPIRFNCPPEAQCIVLRHADKEKI